MRRSWFLINILLLLLLNLITATGSATGRGHYLPDQVEEGVLSTIQRAKLKTEPTCVELKTDYDWNKILSTLREYKEEVTADKVWYAWTIEASVFAAQIKYIAELSNENRKEKGGWAGEFTRATLSIAAAGIAAYPDFWIKNRGGYEEVQIWVERAPGIKRVVLALDAAAWGAAVLGQAHFDMHLSPGFRCLIRQAFLVELRRAPKKRTSQILLDAYGEIVKEHIMFLTHAVEPGFMKVRKDLDVEIPEDPAIDRNRTVRFILPYYAKIFVPADATRLRVESAKRAAKSLVEENIITETDYQQFLSAIIIQL